MTTESITLVELHVQCEWWEMVQTGQLVTMFEFKTVYYVPNISKSVIIKNNLQFQFSHSQGVLRFDFAVLMITK